MFATVKKHLNDAKALSALCNAAEAAARAKGIAEPGSEHFVLASLTLPDQTAAAAFASLGLSRGTFEDAIESQYAMALLSVGIDVGGKIAGNDPGDPPSPPLSPLYRAAASGQALVQRLAASRGQRASRPLVGADVLMAVADEELTVAARALRALGVKPAQLVEAASQCIAVRETR
jgi:hypothetical protein